MPKRDPKVHLPPERTAAPFPSRTQRLADRWRAFHVRDVWWRFLDAWESRAWVRRTGYGVAAAVGLGLASANWIYPWWAKRNAIRIAQQWLDAGKLAYAAEAAARAARMVPDSPQPWLIAAELARRGNQADQALECSRRAAQLAPDNPDAVIAWASDALRANHPDEADRALDSLPIDLVAGSSHAQRIRGEIARQALKLDAAVGYFESAARLEGFQAANQVPLALIQLQSADSAVRRKGLNKLARWTSDAHWGPTALRTLVDDALLRDERPALTQWAEALLAHPARTNADIPRVLLALHQAAPARYAEVLAGLERDHAVNPAAAARLVGWLNGIGRHADAVRWLRTLPEPALRQPPLGPLGAEALRATGAWTELRDWTAGRTWGADQDFLRWCYELAAARGLGETAAAETLVETLRGYALRVPAKVHFAAATLYLWGLQPEALDLWWRVADQNNPAAFESLGALARHYQSRREADGQYRTFRRLYSLQPQNRSVTNNFAFFALLTGHEERVAEQVARDNWTAEPANAAFLATQAFVLIRRGQYQQALDLLKPRAAEAAKSPVIGFAYGLALAGAGRRQEAQPLLGALPPETLTDAEVSLIAKLLSP